MKILSINIAGSKSFTYQGKTVNTGIFKEPVSGRVRVQRLGLDGDVQVDRRVHGGVDKAVYAYPFEHYAHWEKFLGRTGFAFGQFGENLTTAGLLEDDARVGDVWRVGEVVLQVTQPREPCFKLMAKLNDFTFAKPFFASGRTGFYLRVLEEGELGAGDVLERVTSDLTQPTIRAVVRQMIDS